MILPLPLNKQLFTSVLLLSSRLNHARSSKEYSKDAGSKTSFYTFFPESQHVEDVVDKVREKITIKLVCAILR